MSKGLFELVGDAAIAASEGKRLETHKGVWDCLSAFADATGMAFPRECREQVLDSAGRGLVPSKGMLRGAVSTVTRRVEFGAAWKSLITRGKTPEDAKAFRAARAQFAKVARFMASTGSVTFSPECDGEGEE